MKLNIKDIIELCEDCNGIPNGTKLVVTNVSLHTCCLKMIEYPFKRIYEFKPNQQRIKIIS